MAMNVSVALDCTNETAPVVLLNIATLKRLYYKLVNFVSASMRQGETTIFNRQTSTVVIPKLLT